MFPALADPMWHDCLQVHYCTTSHTDIPSYCVQCPRWFEGIVSAGVLTVTPLAARASTHYIHHLDPRWNRGLYFTWWDRLAGTHAASHSLLRQAGQTAKAMLERSRLRSSVVAQD